MNSVFFTCRGHVHILGTHKNTFEFTSDEDVTPQGDCIVGVCADYNVDSIMKLKGNLCVRVRVGDFTEEVLCEKIDEFCDPHEIVIRKSDFVSDRTLGIRSNKGAIDFSREMMSLMKDPTQVMEVEIAQVDE